LVAALAGAPDTPTLEEVGAWIENFSTRRGGRATDWIRAAWAAAAWSLAYNTRCDELLGADADDTHLRACRNDADQCLAKLGARPNSGSPATKHGVPGSRNSGAARTRARPS
jgi:hypothetical protein